MGRSLAPSLVIAALLSWCSSASGYPSAASPAAVSSAAAAPAAPAHGPSHSPIVTPKLPLGDVPADHQGQPARPCQSAGARAVLTFTVEPDTPQPPCWKLRRFRAVQIFNATGDFGQPPRVISGSLRGVGQFRLKPGASVVLSLRQGREFAEGVHCVTINVYPGSCLAIWVTRDAR